MNENLGHKTFFMTRYFILSIFFLAVFMGNANSSQASTGNATKMSVSENSELGSAAQPHQLPPVKNLPALPAAQPFQPVPKAHGHTPTMDELAHIHHFHKGRVKKLKRHHKKCWALSKLLLVLCHIAILVIAYLHAIH